MRFLRLGRNERVVSVQLSVISFPRAEKLHRLRTENGELKTENSDLRAGTAAPSRKGPDLRDRTR